MIHRCHWAGIVGSSISDALLTDDLGRPSRFVHMIRVFRPTSPMNVGTWILAGAAPTAITAGLLLRRRGWLSWLSEGFGFSSGVFGMGLATYTGVLVGNTAIPILGAIPTRGSVSTTTSTTTRPSTVARRTPWRI